MFTTSVLDALPFGVLITDSDLRLTHLNQWILEGLARPLADWRGHGLYEVFPEIHERHLSQLFQLVQQSEQKITLSTRIHQYFLRMPARPGSGDDYMPQSSVISPLRVDGQVTGTITVVYDVTDRQATEQALLGEIDQLARLHQVDSIPASLDLETNLAAIVQHAAEIFHTEQVGVFLDLEGKLKLISASGLDSYYGAPAERLAGSLVEWSFRQRRARSQSYPDPRQKLRPLEEATHREMAVPLLLEDLCLGVILVADMQSGDLKLLEALGHLAAISIHNTQRHAESEYWRGYYREVNSRLQTLLNTIRLMVSHLDASALLSAAANLILEVFHAQSVAIFRPGLEWNTLVPAALAGGDHSTLEGCVVDLPTALEFLDRNGPTGQLTGMAELGSPSQNGLWDLPCPLTYASLNIRKQLEGMVLIVPGPETCGLDDKERELLDALVAQLSLAMENALLFTRQQALVVTDGLTGVYNRRKFDEEIVRWTHLAQRSSRPVALIILDIDNFKSFNDTYGHPAGDDLLQLLARLMKENMRVSDLVARYGGEEFAIILPDLDRNAAFQAGERLRHLIIEHLHLPDCGEGEPCRVTVSMGVAAVPEDALEPHSLVNLADQALYQAKRFGKNRVMAAGESQQSAYSGQRSA